MGGGGGDQLGGRDDPYLCDVNAVVPGDVLVVDPAGDGEPQTLPHEGRHRKNKHKKVWFI